MKNNSIEKIINLALKEDIGCGDITTRSLIAKNQTSQAFILVKEKAVICGLDIVKRVFQKLDPQIKFRSLYKEKAHVPANTKIALISGKTHALLTAERVALNFLSHLCAIATKTNYFVKKTQPFKTKIMDTRKTTPGLRLLEKKAVRCGGGTNHRFTLDEMIFIKDNHHIALVRKIPFKDLLSIAKRKTKKPVEVEVDNLRSFKEILKTKPQIILLDNMKLSQIKKAVQIRKKLFPANHRPLLEVSGNVNEKNILSIAKTGVERISIGALTHTKKAIDVSLEFIPTP